MSAQVEARKGRRREYMRAYRQKQGDRCRATEAKYRAKRLSGTPDEIQAARAGLREYYRAYCARRALENPRWRRLYWRSAAAARQRYEQRRKP